ncbi:M24 family metallopeptidase [Thermodesulfobacteriota bacterium]
MPSTPLDEIQRRIENLQSSMDSEGLDAALIVQRVDLFYFSGTGQDAHLFVPVDGDPQLLVRKSLERAVEDSPLQAVSPIRKLSELQEKIQASIPGGLRRLGMELDVLPVNNFRMYQRLFPDAEIRDVSPLIRDLRMIKSGYELELIRRAATMNDEVFALVRHILKEGMTEVEFAGLLEAEYRKRRHQGLGRLRQFNGDLFYGHVMSGSNLAVPSSSPGPTGGPGLNASFPQGAGDKIVARGEPLQVDYVGILDGYMVDQARTYSIGSPDEKFLRIHETARAIQDTLARMGKPGTVAEDLYNTAMEMAREAGWEEGFLGWPQPVAFVGHGVALELDELPVIGRKSRTVLKEGMVIALEPKFIVPGEGLAGIENTFLVTENGMKRITQFDDAIQVI